MPWRHQNFHPRQSAEFGKDEEVRAALGHIFGAAAVAASEDLDRDGANPAALSAPVGHPPANRNGRGGMAWFLAKPNTVVLAAVLAEALPEPDVAWVNHPTVKGGNLSCLHKEIGGRDFYFFANSSDTPVSTTVRLQHRHRLERWDPHTGKIALQEAKTEGRATVIQLKLDPVSSVFFVSQKRN